MFFIKLQFKKVSNNSGFTLMEILVATSIFVVVMLASLGIHSSILKVSQKTIANNRAQQDTQFIMQSLAKKIRTSRVDYVAYNDEINPNGEDILHLRDLSDSEYSFFASEQNLMVCYGSDCEENAQKIPSDLIQITNLKFYIAPLADPFDINEPPETQPRVTIVMKVSATKGQQESSFTIQQTVPQRSGGIVP